MSRTTLIVSIVSALLFVTPGCAEPSNDLTLVASALVNGTPDAVGVLDFLNDASTTRDVLDHEVPLDARAAKYLIAHRDGADGVFGTADDNLFDDVAEVDSVYWVGPKTINRIAEFAWAEGWTPVGDEHLGAWDGVDFTVDEADTVLVMVNEASFEALDVDCKLDKRAVESIFDARPVLSVPQLASLYYVGPSALTRLKAEVATLLVTQAPSADAPVTQLPADGPGTDCTSNDDCADGLYCIGKPFDGSTDFGKCQDTGSVSGAWADCTSDAACGEGLVCMGAISWGQGWCIAAWMADTFFNDEVVSVPDGDADGIVNEAVVYGLATVPVDMVVTLDIDHARPEDLVVTLTSPNGDVAVLWDHEATPPNPVLASGIPGDDTVNGAYTLTVIDTESGVQGTLKGWSFYVTSNWD